MTVDLYPRPQLLDGHELSAGVELIVLELGAPGIDPSVRARARVSQFGALCCETSSQWLSVLAA